MPRQINTDTLDLYAQQFAAWWTNGHQFGRPDRDRTWLMQEFYNFTYKDEFDYLILAVENNLGGEHRVAFQEAATKLQMDHPRSTAILAKELEERLAVDLDGNHIPGKVGWVQVGQRIVGTRVNKRGFVKNAYWPIYAGEEEERAAGSKEVDPLPEFKQYVDDEHLVGQTRKEKIKNGS